MRPAAQPGRPSWGVGGGRRAPRPAGTRGAAGRRQPVRTIAEAFTPEDREKGAPAGKAPDRLEVSPSPEPIGRRAGAVKHVLPAQL